MRDKWSRAEPGRGELEQTSNARIAQGTGAIEIVAIPFARELAAAIRSARCTLPSGETRLREINLNIKSLFVCRGQGSLKISSHITRWIGTAGGRGEKTKGSARNPRRKITVILSRRRTTAKLRTGPFYRHLYAGSTSQNDSVRERCRSQWNTNHTRWLCTEWTPLYLRET